MAAANGQPAFAVYEYSETDKQWAAHSIHVLALQDDIISTLTLFTPPVGPQLFPAFRLPLSIPDDGVSITPKEPARKRVDYGFPRSRHKLPDSGRVDGSVLNRRITVGSLVVYYSIITPLLALIDRDTF